MRTNDLVLMLATSAAAVEPNVAARRYATAMTLGAAGAMLLMVMLLGARTDLAHALFLPQFWIKLGFVACMVAASLMMAAIELSIFAEIKINLSACAIKLMMRLYG